MPQTGFAAPSRVHRRRIGSPQPGLGPWLGAAPWIAWLPHSAWPDPFGRSSIHELGAGATAAATSPTVAKPNTADLTTQERSPHTDLPCCRHVRKSNISIDLQGHRVRPTRAPARYRIRRSAGTTGRTLATRGRWHHLCTISGSSLRPPEA